MALIDQEIWIIFLPTLNIVEPAFKTDEFRLNSLRRRRDRVHGIRNLVKQDRALPVMTSHGLDALAWSWRVAR
ncbi:MAG: hypothetical protein ABJO80_16765 [Sulfitobacter sp.]|uniref:hypothetical protein n=1 Tax=Sulfitobacter sp. TaxID=1903071 RepID=UPI003299CCBC